MSVLGKGILGKFAKATGLAAIVGTASGCDGGYYYGSNGGIYAPACGTTIDNYDDNGRFIPPNQTNFLEVTCYEGLQPFTQNGVTTLRESWNVTCAPGNAAGYNSCTDETLVLLGSTVTSSKPASLCYNAIEYDVYGNQSCTPGRFYYNDKGEKAALPDLKKTDRSPL